MRVGAGRGGGRLALGALAAAAWLAATPATGGAFVDGNMLYEDCAGEEGARWMACHGYVTATADVLAVDGVGDHRACFQAGISGRQLIDVVRAWLDEHPAIRHHAAAGLVARALAEAFPCDG